MKPVGIIAALGAELAPLREDMLEDPNKFTGDCRFEAGSLYGCPVVLAESSPGKVLASLTAQRLIDRYNPRAIIMTGVSGALRDSLSIGNVVVGSSYMQHDVDARALGLPRGILPGSTIGILNADDALVSLALSATFPKIAVLQGRILSGDQFFTEEETWEKKYLFDEMNGVAIDMESAAVALVCSINGIPFVALRVICSTLRGSQEDQFNSTFVTAVQNTRAIIKHILTNYEG